MSSAHVIHVERVKLTGCIQGIKKLFMPYSHIDFVFTHCMLTQTDDMDKMFTKMLQISEFYILMP